jgi:chitinase
VTFAVKDDGWTVRKDTSGSWGPYAFKGNQWVGYEDVDSVRRKARYVTANSFGGVFAFTLDLDDFNNDCCNGDQPLLRTISKELLGTPFSFKRNDCSQKPQRPDFVPETTTTSKCRNSPLI